jgi:prepilin-type N-terminal cleavage/methylation domain-containing protein
MQHPHNGFTLIELSIVLVIIGLIVGGVLVGRNLVKATEVRAQVTQIEKYQTAANTFYGKYHALPGDMDPATAAQFGLPAHINGSAWSASNNGLIEGLDMNGLNSIYILLGQGNYETGEFWTDLASQGWVEGTFAGVNGACANDINSTNAPTCLPPAKLGNGNYISVYTMNNSNWFGLGAVALVDPNEDVVPSGNALTVAQAYSIDQKIDDGLPTTGNVIAAIYPSWVSPPFPANKQAQSATTCFDNGNVSHAIEQYSASYNGSGINCVMSFKLQAGN